MALEVLEKYEEAIASFDKTIELNPDSYKAWNSKGYLLVQLERDEEALASFDKALEINSTYAPAYYNKALFYALQGQLKLTLENLQKAIDINPRYKQDALAEPDFAEIAKSQRFQKLVNG